MTSIRYQYVLAIFGLLDQWTLRVAGLVFLSDLPTPCFLVDVQAVQKRVGGSNRETAIPPILLQPSPPSEQQSPQRRLKQLIPCAIHGDAETSKFSTSHHIFDPTLDPIDIFHHDLRNESDDEDPSNASAANDASVCYAYIHTRVVEARRQDNILATLDLPHHTKAHLVLGLNNHHVVSYYWARSAGAGAAMEAPGIHLDPRTSQLQWQSKDGFADCNSNDGKRSEWVNFLRKGDQVQLVPTNAAQSAMEYGTENGDHAEHTSGATTTSVYGISSLGRPLGSEPVVVCRWNVESS